MFALATGAIIALISLIGWNVTVKIGRHNYNDPHTYVMTAFRCPEYERLLKILKETDWAAETTPRIVTNVNSTGKNSILLEGIEWN